MFPKLKKWLNKIPKLPVLMVSLSPLICTDVLASQFIEGSDRHHVEVNVSGHEQNRLAIDGRRIGTIVPPYKGALVYIKDEASGALYFSFPKEMGGTGGSSTVSVIVTDEQNPSIAYKLILVPKPIAMEEVIIKPAPDKLKAALKKSSVGRAFSYQRRAKDLVLTMVDETNSDADFIPVNQIIPLWKEGRLVYIAKYVDGDMVGEKYRLTNIGNSDMVLVEQELYRRGVIAVSIENQTLSNHDQTLIFIVRERKDHE